MRRYNNVVLTATGLAVAGANVLVSTASSPPGIGTPATLYSDNGLTTIGNPLSTDAYGRFGFYVQDGAYDLSISGGTPSVVPYILQAEQISDTVGQLLTPSNFTISSNWGGGASLTVIGTSISFQVTIVAGTSGWGVQPTFTLTYPIPLVALPRIVATMIGGTGDVADIEVTPGLASSLYTYTGMPTVSTQTFIIASQTQGG